MTLIEFDAAVAEEYEVRKLFEQRIGLLMEDIQQLDSDQVGTTALAGCLTPLLGRALDDMEQAKQYLSEWLNLRAPAAALWKLTHDTDGWRAGTTAAIEDLRRIVNG